MPNPKEIAIILPDYDRIVWDLYKIATPVSKMPNCPNCKEDELGMMSPDGAFCYCCCSQIKRGE